MSVDADEVAQTLIAQLHAQPLNINILSWKKQTIEYILDGLEKRRIRILPRPENRDVVFELELPPRHHGWERIKSYKRANYWLYVKWRLRPLSRNLVGLIRVRMHVVFMNGIEAVIRIVRVAHFGGLSPKD